MRYYSKSLDGQITTNGHRDNRLMPVNNICCTFAGANSVAGPIVNPCDQAVVSPTVWYLEPHAICTFYL